jgi:hypothetical protein
MNSTDRFAIVQLHEHQPIPDNTIMQGSMDAVMERIIDSNARNTAMDLLRDARIAADQLEQTRAQETQILARGIQSLNDTITRLSRRMDAVEEQQSTKMRHDAALEAKRIQDYLNTLPDPDDPDAAAIFPPDGSLHALPPTNTDSDNEGDLPEELTRATPPPGNPAELDDPPQPKYRQPVAVSLNADDY